LRPELLRSVRGGGGAWGAGIVVGTGVGLETERVGGRGGDGERAGARAGPEEEEEGKAPVTVGLPEW